ncbi:MAG TPA: hypothetical protein VFL36_23895 [Myxococcales bacterium]|nr:hypothetical protein [Myxococcales bacterium]
MRRDLAVPAGGAAAAGQHVGDVLAEIESLLGAAVAGLAAQLQARSRA